MLQGTSRFGNAAMATTKGLSANSCCYMPICGRGKLKSFEAVKAEGFANKGLESDYKPLVTRPHRGADLTLSLR
jgi:hypothetical protein